MAPMDGWIVPSLCRPQAAFKLAHRGPIGDSSWLAEMERWRDETARNARTAGPPKFGHGGARPGAGRKKRTLNEITQSSKLNEKEAAEQVAPALGRSFWKQELNRAMAGLDLEQGGKSELKMK
jgi:hypothetical protein